MQNCLSLDNLLQKNVIVFFFFFFLEIKFRKGTHLNKRVILTYFSHFLLQKIPLAHCSLTYMYFAQPIDFFLPY